MPMLGVPIYIQNATTASQQKRQSTLTCNKKRFKLFCYILKSLDLRISMYKANL